MANCIGSDTNNAQSNWPKKVTNTPIQDRQVNFSTLQPALCCDIAVQQQSIDRWPDSWQARHMGLKKGCLAHAKMATAA